MQMLIDHWEVALLLASCAFTVGGAWTLLKREIKEIKGTLAANRAHMDRRFEEMAQNCTARNAACQRIHDGFEGAIERHHEDTELHMTDNERKLIAEWRTEVLKRFDRLEGLILNGSAKRAT